MAGKAEELKGRAKEAAGAITDNDKLAAKEKSTRPRARSSKRPTRSWRKLRRQLKRSIATTARRC